MYACLWFVRAKLQKIIDICKNFAYFYKKRVIFAITLRLEQARLESELSAGFELNSLLCRNVNNLLCCRIDALASSLLSNLQSCKANQLYSLTLLQSISDCVKSSVKALSGSCLRDLSFCCDCSNEFTFVHNS